MFPHLFSPLKVGSVELKNRIVFTGHATNLTVDGHPNDELVAYQRARAKGGAGLVVTQVSHVHPSGWHEGTALRAFSDDCIPHYARVAKAVGEYDCRVFGQLFTRAGRSTRHRMGPVRWLTPPSALPTDRFHVMPRAMSIGFVEELVESFGDAARRMQEAGYEGVEIIGTQGI